MFFRFELCEQRVNSFCPPFPQPPPPRWAREQHQLRTVQGKTSSLHSPCKRPQSNSTFFLFFFMVTVWKCFCVSSLQFNYSTGINYETLGPDEVRSLLTTVSSRFSKRQLAPKKPFQSLIMSCRVSPAAMWGDLRTHQEDVHQVITLPAMAKNLQMPNSPATQVPEQDRVITRFKSWR